MGGEGNARRAAQQQAHAIHRSDSRVRTPTRIPIASSRPSSRTFILSAAAGVCARREDEGDGVVAREKRCLSPGTEQAARHRLGRRGAARRARAQRRAQACIASAQTPRRTISMAAGITRFVAAPLSARAATAVAARMRADCSDDLPLFFFLHVSRKCS